MAEDLALYRVSVESNGDIYEMVGLNKNRKLGIDIGRERELLQMIQERDEQIKEHIEVLDSWRPKMILHGYIEIPKTPEEIAQEAAAEQIRIAQAQADRQIKIAQENARKQDEFIQAQAQAMYQQTQAMTAMMSVIAKLDTKLGGVTNEPNGNISPVDDEPSPKQRSEDSPKSGKKPGASKGGTRPSK